MTRSRPWGGSRFEQYLFGMTRGSSTTAYDRVIERRRAVALARHLRDAGGLSIAQIAHRLAGIVLRSLPRFEHRPSAACDDR